MNANLVQHPRLAVTTAFAIVAAVAIVAALFPNTIRLAEIPERGNSVEDLWGRTFVAVEATEGGQPYQLHEDWPPSVTFRIEGWVRFRTICGEMRAEYRLDEGRLDWRTQPTNDFLPCGGRRLARGEWLEAFLAERPAWRLHGNTLELSSDFGTMTMVDNGAGSEPSEILGKRFVGGQSATAGKRGKPRLRGHFRLWLSFDRDGTMHAKLGCESVVVPTEVKTGWFRITEALLPQRTTDCSRSMAAQETAWMWELLDQPVRWQIVNYQSIVLKPYRSDQDPIYLDRFAKGERRTDPEALAGKTFATPPYFSRSENLDGYRGVTIEVDSDGDFAASAGCPEPSIHGRFRTGWVQFGDDLQWSLSACEDVEAEQWLADFLAHQPSWDLRRHDELVLYFGSRGLGLLEEGAYRGLYGDR